MLVVFTKVGLNPIPHEVKKSWVRVTVATPVWFAETSCPILATNVPVVRAGTGFKTLESWRETLDMAESDSIAPEIVTVLEPAVPP